MVTHISGEYASKIVSSYPEVEGVDNICNKINIAPVNENMLKTLKNRNRFVRPNFIFCILNLALPLIAKYKLILKIFPKVDLLCLRNYRNIPTMFIRNFLWMHELINMNDVKSSPFQKIS